MQRLLQYIVSIMIFGIILSCKNKVNNSIVDFEVPTPITDPPDSLRKKQVLDNLVSEITKLERLEAKYIGYASQKSSQRDYSLDLLKLADTNYLLKLTSHNNPIVRVISFDVLVTKGFVDIKKVFKDHIEDNETYQLYAGCLITHEQVNLSMYNKLANQLTPKEKAYFGKLIKKQLNKSKYWAASLFEASI